jgi:thiamine-phosphate pyrophosphorylase
VDADQRAERGRRLARLRGLYAIVGDEDSLARAAAAVDGGAAAVQLRLKYTPSGPALERARGVVALAAGRALVIVNDRADLALLSGADGVHLGDQDLPVAEARRIVGAGLLLGRTCRSAGEAREALAQGADHVGYGPVFASRTKPIDAGPFGLAGLRATCAAVPAPVVAISGIELSNIAGVAAAGAACAAVIGDLFDRGDPRTRAELLSRAFAEGAGRRA